MSVEPRFLARRSEDGYVHNASQALPGEPEAVSEDEQQRITEKAERREREQRIQARQATAEEIARELEYHESRCRFLRRELGRLKR